MENTESKWIKVSERLPEDNMDVLVVKHNGLVCMMSFHAGFDEGKRKFWWWGFSKWIDQDRQITHWMPIPKKPKD